MAGVALVVVGTVWFALPLSIAEAMARAPADTKPPPCRGKHVSVRFYAELRLDAGLLRDSFRFEPMFDAIHPPHEVSKSHGLFVQWEVQLLHDRLVEHELIPASRSFRETDFLYAA